MSARMILPQSNGGILKQNKIYFGKVYREFLYEKQDFKDKDLSRKYLVSMWFRCRHFWKVQTFLLPRYHKDCYWLGVQFSQSWQVLVRTYLQEAIKAYGKSFAGVKFTVSYTKYYWVLFMASELWLSVTIPKTEWEVKKSICGVQIALKINCVD